MSLNVNDIDTTFIFLLFIYYYVSLCLCVCVFFVNSTKCNFIFFKHIFLNTYLLLYTIQLIKENFLGLLNIIEKYLNYKI